MKKKIYAAAVILVLISIPQVQGLQTDSLKLTISGVIVHPSERLMTLGLNYLSPYLTYSSMFQPDEVLRRDFTRFKADGIDIVSLEMYWYRLEGNTRGSYDGGTSATTNYGDRFLDEIKRNIKIANESGIKVLLTFHTLWGNDDSPWCTPDYVVDPVAGNNIGLAIVRSDSMRQAFIDMFNHTVSYLSDTAGIWAWAVLNEPQYWGRNYDEHDFMTNNGNTQKENFITLFQELSNIVRTSDGRPVTIRLINAPVYTGLDGQQHIENIFANDWGWDQRLFDAVDFVSLNVYIPQHLQLVETWKNLTASNIVGISQINKQIWITEFGSALTDQSAQANDYQTMLNFFATLPVSGCLAWQWTSGIIPPGWDDPESQSPYNICTDAANGTGGLAYSGLHL